MTDTAKRKRPVDPNTQLPDVGSKYGAPMGRSNVTDNPSANVRLFFVTMIDGDYDMGGAYWGGSEPRLFGVLGEGFMAFCRAGSLEEAKESFLKDFPDLKIFTMAEKMPE